MAAMVRTAITTVMSATRADWRLDIAAKIQMSDCFDREEVINSQQRFQVCARAHIGRRRRF
jgi:hypothetical protein